MATKPLAIVANISCPFFVLSSIYFNLIFVFPVRSLQFLRRHVYLLNIRHQQSGTVGAYSHRSTASEQHGRTPATGVRDTAVLLDWHCPDSDELCRPGIHRQLHIGTRVLGFHVGRSHSRYYVTGERPDRRQRQRRQFVGDVHDHVRSHQLHQHW